MLFSLPGSTSLPLSVVLPALQGDDAIASTVPTDQHRRCPVCWFSLPSDVCSTEAKYA